MKYYTAKGDGGTTNLFSCSHGTRVSKGEKIFDVLGGLDELNSHIGLCRAVTMRASFPRADAETRSECVSTLSRIQEHIFIIQAELGGSSKRLLRKHLEEVENAVGQFATVFSPIQSFVLPGQTELAALLDITRTITRRVERRYIRLGAEYAEKEIGPYLNRLSSLLYVLARFAVHAQGESEQAPTYQ